MSGIGLQQQQQPADGVGLGMAPSAPTAASALTAIPPQAPPLSADDLASIAKTYPALAPLLKNTAVQWGNGPPEYQSEFYHPWEEENPNKGKATLELYNQKLKPDEIKSLVPAEMLHLMGAVDPTTGAAVDLGWQHLKQQFLGTRTPEQMKADLQDYQDTKDPRNFKDYMQESRGDAYLRAAVFPDINPEWSDYLTPQQRQLGDEMRAYLQGKKK